MEQAPARGGKPNRIDALHQLRGAPNATPSERLRLDNVLVLGALLRALFAVASGT